MLLHLALILFNVSWSQALLTSKDFHRLVAPECFRVGQIEELEDLPRTVKSFVELVSKVEKAHRLEDAAETASLLLRRFSISYMRRKRTENGHMFLVDKTEEARASVTEVLLRSAPHRLFREDSLILVEKCALFFMLSHSIEQRNNGANVLAYIEHGVVSPVVHPEGNHGLALSPVLFGIAASKYASRESTESLLRLLRPYSNVVSEGHSVIDHLYGPTLASLLGTSVKWKNTTASPIIGRNGVWTTPLCPKEFKLSPKVSDITDAQLSGAIDGFLFNVLTSRITKQRKRPFTLSQLLSTYYSARGIRELIPEFPGGASFCTRGKIFQKLFSVERLTEQTLAIARLFNAVEALPLKEVIENYAIVPAVKKFSQELEHIITHPPSTCQEAQRQLHKGSCQTLSNVLLLLDPISGHPQFDVYQRKLSAYLSEEILENNSNSRVSISSSSLADNPHVLNLFFSSSRKQKNPSCRVSRRADKGCAECHEADIWRAVNGTWNSLLEDDVEMAAGTVTPSKVVVYFKFNDFKSKEEDLQDVIRGLRRSHKDLYIFVVGPKPEIVEKFRADVKDAVVIIPQAADDKVIQRISTELAHEICQTPAIVHCTNCLTDHLQVSSIHQVFLSPQASYSWAVYPDELNRYPILVNITITSENLPLRVCYERQNATHQRVPIEEDQCEDAQANVPLVKSFVDLCQSQEATESAHISVPGHVQSARCEMVHFKITALPRRPGVPFKECNHPDCRFPDETRVEIAYFAEFEDDLLQTSNQLNMFRYPPIDDRRGQKSPRLSSVLGRPNSIERDSQETSENRELSKPSEDIRTETEGPNPRPVRPHDEPSRNPVVDHSRGNPKEVPERKLQLHSLGQQIIDPPNDQPDDTRDFLNRPQKIHNLLQLNKQLQLKPDSSYGRLDPTSKRPDGLREVNTPGHSLRISRNQFKQSERPVRQPESPFRYSERLPDLHETAETDLVNGKQQIDNDDTNRTKFSARERPTDYPSDRSQRPLPPINKSIERPLNFFELYQFVDKPLRPHEMAQVCSSSKQESFLFTIDQFLLILKKLEEGNPSVTIKEMCQFLLDKYSLDSPLRANSSLVENDVLRSVQRALLGSSTSSKQTDGNDGTTDVDDSVLLASERCHLYHLLSYSKEAELERGVVALDFDEDIAIALKPVLLGILGSPSLVGESSRSINQITRSLNHAIEVQHDAQSRITILSALTFGGILLPEIIRDARSDLVDSDSYWHEQFCQNNFVRRPERDDVDSWITYTRIRGAIDGYILGLHGNLTSAVSLCSLLDGYYSNRGVDRSMRTKPDLTYDNGNSVQLGVCRRYDLFPADVITGNLEREFLNFYRAFAYAYPGLVNRVSEAIVMDAATRVIKKITRATQYKLLSMPSFCDDGPALSIANPTIETATEIYVVLKTDDERFMPVEEMQLHWAHQKAFVSFLARHMNLGTRRRLHLFMNQQSIVHGQLLGVPTKHAGAAASSIACKAQEILGNSDRMKSYSPQDEATVLDALQLHLSNETEIGALLETREGHGNLRPARIVVWLAHGSEQRSPKGVIKTAVERLKQNFKETVSFFAVTTSLSSYFGEELFSVKFWNNATNKGQLAIRNRARDLARESFLAPLIALCGPACLESTIPVHLRFDEVISENAVKVVRFGTEEFPSMVRAQLTVTPTNGIIKVCYDKNDVPSIDGWRRCTQLADNVLSFRPDCQKDGQCESILLAIMGVRENCEASSCTGKINFVLDYDERPRKRRQSPKNSPVSS